MSGRGGETSPVFSQRKYRIITKSGKLVHKVLLLGDYENNVNSNLNEASKNDNVAENIKEVTEKTSGDNIDFSVYDGKYICTVIVSKDNCSRLCYYEVEFKDGKWSIIKL